MDLRKRVTNGQQEDVSEESINNGNSSSRKNSRESNVVSKSSSGRKVSKRGSWKMPKRMKLLLEFLLVSIVSISIIILVIFPLVFKVSPFIRRQILFMNWVNFPIGKNLSNPESEYELNCTRPLVIESTIGFSRDVTLDTLDTNGDQKSDQKIKLGLWHILPASRIHECDLNVPERLANPFEDNRPIILYFHGNGGARGGAHRRGLYRVLAYNLDYHVITFDYRGYGDSENIAPSLPGMVHDSQQVYQWLLKQVNGDRNRIIIWGHSLGTAIATYVVSSIQEGNKVPTGGRRQPPGLVLEAPFNSLQDVVTEHPFAILYRRLPYFHSFIVEPLILTPDTSINPSSKVGLIHSPIMILHAEDDAIIPYDLGYKLYQNFEESRTEKSTELDNGVGTNVRFVRFDSSRGYGHKAIFKDTELPAIIKNFVDTSLELRQRSSKFVKDSSQTKEQKL